MNSKKIYFPFVLLLTVQMAFAQSNYNSSKSRYTSRASDSLELVKFSEHTLGKLWKEKWDFSEPIDDWFGVLLTESGRVFCIDLDGDPFCNPAKSGGNHLHGTFPPDLNLPFLEHLFLSSNKISGKLPDLDGVPNLLTLQLSGNRLEGKIPPLVALQRLVKLDLEYNGFYGELPAFELKNLESLYLSKNYISGELPGFEGCPKLKHLYINHNQLQGPLPDFRYLIQLNQLIVSHNNFSKKLPDYTRLYNLDIFIANDNELEGCYMKSKYDNLRIFNIANNSLHECQPSDFNIPDAFSPNGDGVNDVFDLSIVPDYEFLLQNNSFMVWNSNKIPVYINEDFDGKWDGKSNTKGIHDLPEGLYIYTLKSGTNIAKGTVYIKR